MSKTVLGILLLALILVAIGTVYYYTVQQGQQAQTTTTTTTTTQTTTPQTTTQTTETQTTTTTTQITGEIDFYTSIPKDMATQLVQMFREKYPGIKVNLYRSGTSKVLAKLQAEIESGNIIADVIWVADPSGIISLKEQGLLLKFTPSCIDKLKFKDPDGYWYAGRIIIPVIAWNTNIIKDNPPKSWTDLASQDYKKTLPSPWNTANGWAAIPNPLYSGAAVATVYALVEKYGWDYYKNLETNGVIVVKSNSVVLNGIINGEHPVGVTLDYMVRGKMNAGEPVNYVFPEDGVVAIPSPIAIMKSTSYPEAARLFVEFLLSEEVQKWLAEHGVIPGRSDVAPPENVPSLDQLNIIDVNWDELARKAEEIRSTFENIMLK